MAQMSTSNGERGYLSPFLWIFLFVGIVLSALVGDLGESLLQSGGIAGITTGVFNKKGFFLHVLFSRLTYMTAVILLSTTSLRRLFLILQPALLSLGMGVWMGAAIGEFGIKGILLVLAGLFPHMLLYIFILRFLIIVLWDRTHYDKQFFIAIFVLFFMAIIGCLLESYVNPLIVAKILKIF